MMPVAASLVGSEIFYVTKNNSKLRDEISMVMCKSTRFLYFCSSTLCKSV
ncbi:unnamed protein product [Moneuplotes crassus]|uniref:Uncharacterized protein n=1 Tax=Euplotes crassus TaxID=5936 RepID=A0AAD1XVZ5_EUPCR|nr:unnamed protein product [Moneuplotes crassus]